MVGWLVCVEGAEKGRDYRIHAGRNFIGRSLKMDIAVVDDVKISRENHCSVVYDPHSNGFSLVPGEGTNTYLGGQQIMKPQPINDNDEIKLGDSMFVFISYCKGERKWL